MLADGVEARARSQSPNSDDDLRNVVQSVVERIEKEGQLDNTQLTLGDLNQITDAFVASLRGTYHPRIQYPAAELPATSPAPTTPLNDKQDK